MTSDMRGSTVRRARASMGLTLREVAYFAETTEASLSRIERGLQEPSVTLKVRLARVLGEPLSELFPLPQRSSESEPA